MIWYHDISFGITLKYIFRYHFAGGSGGTKRDASQAVPGAKPKPKVVRPSPPSSVNPSMPSLISMPNLQDNLWESGAIECDASDLVRLIDDAETINNSERIEGKVPFFQKFKNIFFQTKSQRFIFS